MPPLNPQGGKRGIATGSLHRRMRGSAPRPSWVVRSVDDGLRRKQHLFGPEQVPRHLPCPMAPALQADETAEPGIAISCAAKERKGFQPWCNRWARTRRLSKALPLLRRPRHPKVQTAGHAQRIPPSRAARAGARGRAGTHPSARAKASCHGRGVPPGPRNPPPHPRRALFASWPGRLPGRAPTRQQASAGASPPPPKRAPHPRKATWLR